jgi:hypothetical protein
MKNSKTRGNNEPLMVKLQKNLASERTSLAKILLCKLGLGLSKSEVGFL